jgi:hypothetical protein
MNTPFGENRQCAVTYRRYKCTSPIKREMIQETAWSRPFICIQKVWKFGPLGGLFSL